MSDIVDDIEIVINHSSIAIESLRRTKHLRSSQWILVVITSEVIRKINLLVLLRWRLLLVELLLINAWVVVGLHLDIAAITLEKIIIVRILRHLIRHRVITAAIGIVVSLVCFLVQFFILVTLGSSIV